MTAPAPTVFVQLQTSVDRHCIALAGLTVRAPTQIAIVSDRTPDGDRHARELRRAVLNALIGTGATAPRPCPCGSGVAPEGCSVRTHVQPRRVLVMVGSDQPFGIDPATDPLALEWLSLPPDVGAIVPVLPKGIPPFRVLPDPIRERIVLFHQDGNVAAVVPDLLTVAGVGSDDFRLFISYRHGDVAAIATQLFEALSAVRFDVFLDRFRGTSGRSFLVEIQNALADKACVLVLESPRVTQSNYVLGEIVYATLYNMGLMAVLLPKGIPITPVSQGARLDLRRSVVDATDPDCRLWKVDCRAVVEFVRENYAAQLERRRRFQRDALRRELALAGAPLPPPPTAGVHTVTSSRAGAPQRRYQVLTTARAPAVSNFLRVSGACGASDTGVILGPLPFQRSPRGYEMDWLKRQSGIHIDDEINMVAVVEDMTDGTL